MSNQKVVQLNLESGSPTVAAALSKMINALTTYKQQGVKAVILIHGYGSTGVGGGIKVAVSKCLGEKSMCGIVRAFACGEQWVSRKRELLSMYNGLAEYERRISGNEGISVVILR